MIKTLEENGVTYSANSDSNCFTCIDIDVKPGVKEVQFLSFFSKYELTDSKKSFPDVRKINICYSVLDIAIPNTLFPNVEEVTCDCSYGKYTKNGKVLLKNDDLICLTNTFIKKENEVVDLNGTTKIMNDAFSGCLSTKIINSKNVVECEEYAFRNSAIGKLNPSPGGAVVVGSILVNIDETAENIVIPDKNIIITAMRDEIDFTNVKSITVNRVQTLINLQYKLPDDIKIILNDKSFITAEQLLDWKIYPSLELSNENPYYATKDGCLVSKDGSVLMKYPSAAAGTVHISDGIETISSYAFFGCQAEEIYLPDSTQILMPECFSCCTRLRKIDFGHGIKKIGFGHNCKLFYACNMLHEVEIPSQVREIGESAFLESGISKVTFHEGLIKISDFAFKLPRIKEVKLPASLKYIGRQNFIYVDKITLSTDNIPYGIVEALSSNTPLDTDTMCIKIEKPNSTVFMPRYIAPDDVVILDSMLAIPSLREKYEDSLYDYGMEPEVKWDVAIKTCKYRPNDSVKTYLRRVSKNIASMYLENFDERALIDFIKLGIMTPKALEHTYKKAKEKGLTTVMAYICEAQKNFGDKKSSFSL